MRGTRFSIDKDNRLIYWLNEPVAWRRKSNLPDKIVVEGRWQLDAGYNLKLELQERKGKFAEDISSFEGEIISAQGNALVFEFKTVDKDGLSHMQILKLTGLWQVDDSNRLIFKIEHKQAPDVLLFEGAWRVNRNQQLEFACQRSGLKKKDKSLCVLNFFGVWQITASDQLTYILSGSSESEFDFKVQLESPNIYPKQGVIKYRVGAGIKNSKINRAQIISLYGTWKFSRSGGISYEMEYYKREIHALKFAALVNFKKNNEILFELKDEMGKDLGISLTFTHRFLEQLDAQIFLRLKTLREQVGADVGIRIPF